jgi:hypothetical protein
VTWGAALGLALALKLVGTLDLPKDLAVDGAPFGGISGVDYDRKSGEWLMISDDRSDKAPARFYVGRLDYDLRGVRGLKLTRQAPLRRVDGATFSTAEGERADAEALRIDPWNGELVWSTEGDAPRGFDPAVRRMGRDGAPRGAIPTPAGFRFTPIGARPNLTFEGLSFSPDGRWLWLAMEAPLIQDGPVSSVAQGGLTRITRLNRAGGMAAQYAYRLDPIQAAPARRGDNGISEILAVDDRQLLVLERSGVEDAHGRFAYHCRLYLVDMRGAKPGKALAKRLLVNLDHIAGGGANYEAMAWGPRIGGRRTLVLFADDNFNPLEARRVVVFSQSSR